MRLASLLPLLALALIVSPMLAGPASSTGPPLTSSTPSSTILAPTSDVGDAALTARLLNADATDGCTGPGMHSSVVEPFCAPAIRPGAHMTSPAGCTMNFVVTDGIDLFIGTAGHCVRPGQRVHLEGVGWIGTVVRDGGGGDWGFVRIDPEDHARVDPTMCRWQGPNTGPTGDNVRDPMHGETVLHYGHGFLIGAQEPTRGRAGVVAHTTFLRGDRFVFVGDAAPGDSGSPVRLATGEAAGILVAVLAPVSLVPNVSGQVVLATKFTRAMASLEGELGRPVTLVEGTPALPEPPLAPVPTGTPPTPALADPMRLPAWAA